MKRNIGKTIKEYNYVNDGNGVVIEFTDGTKMAIWATPGGEYEQCDIVEDWK